MTERDDNTQCGCDPVGSSSSYTVIYSEEQARCMKRACDTSGKAGRRPLLREQGWLLSTEWALVQGKS